MSDTKPDPLIADALGFFAMLAKNNTRDWFKVHKADYEARVKGPATALMEAVGAGLRARFGVEVTPKLYRIHRDVRFSKDKTPYNTHLHLQWVGGGCAWYFGLSAAYCCAGAGAMGFDKTALERWRAVVAGPDGETLEGIVGTMLGQGARLDAPELKRVPAPFGQDHPRGDLLRRKSLVLWRDLDPQAPGDLAGRLDDAFAALAPVRDILQRLG